MGVDRAPANMISNSTVYWIPNSKSGYTIIVCQSRSSFFLSVTRNRFNSACMRLC